jgi:hypothetical protein
MKPDAYSGEARLGRIRDKEAVINELSYVDPMTPSLGETVKKLRDKLYACGSCGHDDNVRLKNEFESVADGLFIKRDSIREEYKRQKEGIILEAERLSYSTDYKSAKDQMQSLRERWKQIPRGAKADEDVLWFRFKQASDRLYENARQDYERRQAQQREAKARKEQVINQIERLAYTGDFKSAGIEVKRLSDEFYNAGSAGRDNQDLKERFNAARNRFYAAKQQAGQIKHQEYLRSLDERINRKRDALNRLENAIYNKRDQLSNLLSRPEPSYNNPHRWEIAARRNAKESEINAAIRDMEIKRASIINEIAELQSKYNNSR